MKTAIISSSLNPDSNGFIMCKAVEAELLDRGVDVLFIDASKHFEKIKTQNSLREEDIDKIISTYRERKTEDKYAHLASKEELLENEFNLNISRYVDTFEKEENINLNAVISSINTIDAELTKINADISKSGGELDINLPI